MSRSKLANRSCSPLVEANAVAQYLDSWASAAVVVGLAVLRADVRWEIDGLVAGEGRVGEVCSLGREVEGEGCRVEVRLQCWHLEHTLSSHDGHRNRDIRASLRRSETAQKDRS